MMVNREQSGTDLAPGLSAEAVRAQLEKILASGGLVHSERLRRFLRFSVEQALEGRPEKIKEYVIGLEVFDKEHSYDPNTDPIVRVEARRLRFRLKEYYATEGRGDPIVIDLPKGGYLATFRHHEAPEEPPIAARRARLRPSIIAAASIATTVVLLAGAAAWWWRSRPVAAPALILTRLTSDSGLTTDPTLSPDGTLVAYASDRGGNDLDLWVQQVSGGEPIRLTRHEADDHEPVFSPDGTKIAFRSERRGGGIYVIPSLGGEERLIAEQGRGPRFSPDGDWIAYWVGSIGDEFLAPAGKAYLVPAPGGSPRPFQPDFYSAVCPVWSPDGKRVLFAGARDTGSPLERTYDWWVAPAQGGQAVSTGAMQQFRTHGITLSSLACAVSWVGDEIIFPGKFGDGINLWRASFSNASWRLRGAPQRLTFGTGLEVHPSAGKSGQMVFASLAENVNVWSVRMESNQARVTSGMERLTESAGRDIFPSVSADGSKMAFLSDRTGVTNIWMKDLESGKERPLTFTPSRKRYPKISSGGNRVAYTEYSKAGAETYLVNTEGGTPEKICDDCARVWHWSSDGKQILYEPFEQGGSRRIAVLDLSTGRKFDLLKHARFDLAEAHLSPDDKWVAFHTIPSPVHRQLFIAPVRLGRPAAESEWVIVRETDRMDRNAVWSPDGHILYFLSEWDGFRCVWARGFFAANPYGSMVPVHHFHSARRSLSNLGDVGAIGLSVAPHKLIFSLGELTGNVWLAKPQN